MLNSKMIPVCSDNFDKPTNISSSQHRPQLVIIPPSHSQSFVFKLLCQTSYQPLDLNKTSGSIPQVQIPASQSNNMIVSSPSD